MRKYLKIAVYLLMVAYLEVAGAGAYEDFFAAVAADDDKGVQSLLARGFDVNSVDPKGQPALFLALRDGSAKVAETLWRSPQLDVDRLNASGESALMMAALRGRVDWMRRLLERGARSHQEGWSPIHYAATGDQPAAVALMLDRGAPIDARSPNGTTPLMMAARYGVEGSVDLLLARGADAARRNALQLDAADFARQAGRDFLADRLQRAAKR
jgi:ankyrin repeat protein